jgi:glycosidase
MGNPVEMQNMKNQRFNLRWSKIILRGMGVAMALFFALTLNAQAPKLGLYRVDPPFWWAGMQNQNLELILIGEGIGKKTPTIIYPGVTLSEVIHSEEDGFLFLKLSLSDAVLPGKFDIQLTEGKTKEFVPYELRARTPQSNRQQGIDGRDVIYLIMPDRFANGNPKNDDFKGLNQRGTGRDSILLRHGGDLQGIQEHLPYMVDLGVTALWLNPIQENDEPKESYHGYAITDHYRVDPRLGDNESYRKLVEQCHSKGLKMIMDMVYNHWGDKHYLNKRLPSPDWIHQQKEFQRTSYRANTLIDPHASDSDLKIFTDNWFDRHMPDLDQTNPRVASYLIQNSIWWIEYANLDAFRIDTYLYSDQQFMRDLLAAIFREYPKFGVFGETWVQGTALQAYVTRNTLVQAAPATLPGVTDFQLYDAINEALSRKMGWTEGISRMYTTLAEDYLYADPNQNVVFLDNHDLSRFYSMVGKDLRKFKMGIAWLLTMRGIPQLFYGTEILMDSYSGPDAKVRIDFPGGWAGDTRNKFTPAGRTEQENEAFDYLRTLLRWRKGKSLFKDGKLTHFVPADGIYVYFRTSGSERIMVVMNCNDEGKKLPLGRFAECLKGAAKFKDAVTGLEVPMENELGISPWTTLVLEVQ